MAKKLLVSLLLALSFAACLGSGLYFPSLGECYVNENNEPFAGGNGTEEDPYIICSRAQFDSFAFNPFHWKFHFRLGTDIDLNSSEAVIGDSTTEFTGSFNGGGHYIRNLTITRSGDDNMGLFGRVASSGRIYRLKLDNISVDGNSSVGAVVGHLAGRLDYVFASGSISSSTGNVGGLVGTCDPCEIYDSYFIGSVNAVVGNHTGGIVGWQNGGTLSNVFSAGSVSSPNDFVGGLIGNQSGGTIYNSWTSTNVSGAGSNIEETVGFDVSYNYLFYDANTSCAGGCTATIGTGIDTSAATGNPSYFYQSYNPPMDVWDFNNVWITNSSSYPGLRY